MSENRNRGTRDFSKYDSMSTEELEKILRLDSEAPVEQESDTELMFYIMGVLAGRPKENTTGKTAFESWEDFQKNYLDVNDETPPEENPKPKFCRYWVYRLAAAAAVLVLVIGLSAKAQAVDWDALWNTVARWTKNTFSFVSEDLQENTQPSSDTVLKYNSLQEALKLTGMEYDFVPTWIPDGFQLQGIIVDENPMQNVYAAQYSLGEKELKITVRSHLMDDLEHIEIKGDPLEVYISGNIEYTILTNQDQLRAAWLRSPYECYISGDLTIDELKSMIDSIGKG